MAKKIFTKRTAILLILLLFLGSVIGGAVEYSIGREKVKLPGANIMKTPMTEGQRYAVLSQGLLLLKLSVPIECDLFCQRETTNIEGVVQKYAPYVYLEEVKEGTKLAAVAAVYSGEEEIKSVNATTVEDKICLAMPLHPECRRLRALEALKFTSNNETGNSTNISLGG